VEEGWHCVSFVSEGLSSMDSSIQQRYLVGFILLVLIEPSYEILQQYRPLCLLTKTLRRCLLRRSATSSLPIIVYFESKSLASTEQMVTGEQKNIKGADMSSTPATHHSSLPLNSNPNQLQ
jgi:hypothetical protein